MTRPWSISQRIGKGVLVRPQGGRDYSRRAPEAKRDIWAGKVDTSVKDGGAQIEYQDQDPRIHALWLAEMDANGTASGMGGLFDEAAIRGIR